MRKLKELGLTEALEIGYRLSPRGRAVVHAINMQQQQQPQPGCRPGLCRAVRLHAAVHPPKFTALVFPPQRMIPTRSSACGW